MEYGIETAKRLLPDFIWRALQMASKQLVTFSILFITAKLTTPEKFGIYNYLIAYTFLFALIADFGISRAITKFTAEYKVKDETKINSILFNSGIILISITLLIIGIILVFGELIIGNHHDMIVYLIPVFIFLPLSSLYDGMYSGLSKFKKLSHISIISALITISSSYFLISGYGIIGAFIALDMYYFLMFILLFASYNNHIFKFDINIFKEIYRYSILIGVASLGHFLYSKALVIILGKYGFFTQAGYYEMIDKVFMLITIGIIIFGQVIAPKITKLYAENNYKLIYKLLNKITFSILLLGCAASVVLYFAFPTVLEFFLPRYNTPDFIKMFNLLLLHLPLVLISAGLAQPFVIGTGNARLSLITIPFGIINVAFAIYFVNLYGFIAGVVVLLFVSIISKLTLFIMLFNKLKGQI